MIDTKEERQRIRMSTHTTTEKIHEVDRFCDEIDRLNEGFTPFFKPGKLTLDCPHCNQPIEFGLPLAVDKPVE